MKTNKEFWDKVAALEIIKDDSFWTKTEKYNNSAMTIEEFFIDAIKHQSITDELREEEAAVKYVSEAEELDTIIDEAKLELYARWVGRNSFSIPLWLGPVGPGKINVIVAGTGAGKSTFLQNLAHYLTKRGTVLYLSGEEDQGTIALKLKEVAKALMDRRIIEEESNIVVKELRPGSMKDLEKQFQALNNRRFDFIIFDYIKSNLLEGDLPAHEAVSKITDAFFRNVVRPNLKSVCFAGVQANSTGNNATIEMIAADYIPFVEGRAYVPRHASSLIFLVKDGSNSKALLCKSRNMARTEMNTIYYYQYGGLDSPYLIPGGVAAVRTENKIKGSKEA